MFEVCEVSFEFPDTMRFVPCMVVDLTAFRPQPLKEADNESDPVPCSWQDCALKLTAEDTAKCSHLELVGKASFDL
jgi:hypothetical protein